MRNLPDADANTMMLAFVKYELRKNFVLIAEKQYDESIYIIFKGEISGVKNFVKVSDSHADQANSFSIILDEANKRNIVFETYGLLVTKAVVILSAFILQSTIINVTSHT